MVKEQVLEMLEEICEDEVVREDLDINMKEEGLMDSLAFVEMLVKIEEIFGLSIAPTEVTYEEIDTPNKVISYIENRKYNHDKIKSIFNINSVGINYTCNFR